MTWLLFVGTFMPLLSKSHSKNTFCCLLYQCSFQTSRPFFLFCLLAMKDLTVHFKVGLWCRICNRMLFCNWLTRLKVVWGGTWPCVTVRLPDSWLLHCRQLIPLGVVTGCSILAVCTELRLGSFCQKIFAASHLLFLSHLLYIGVKTSSWASTWQIPSKREKKN